MMAHPLVRAGEKSGKRRRKKVWFRKKVFQCERMMQMLEKEDWTPAPAATSQKTKEKMISVFIS